MNWFVKNVNIPNLISLTRLCLLPLVYLLVTGGYRPEAFALVLFLSVTDWVDGYIARTTGQVTELGKLLDPLADRLMVVVVVYSLFAAGTVSLAVMLAFGLRELAALFGYAIFAVRGTRFAVSTTGKNVATFVYICIALSVISSTAARFLWVAATAYWLSLLLYLKKDKI